jgi:long-chain acyl-CoA synthetase
MLTQRNLVSNAAATAEAHQRGPGDLQLCFLPLSHAFARTCDLYTWIVQGSQLALAESRETVLADCRRFRPTVINAVPYFYQRVYRQWRQQSGTISLRELLGGRVRECCCGGAPLSDDLSDAFEQQDVRLLPGYGLTEASPVVAVSTPHQYKRGAVGRPIPGVQVCVADDGELLTRGPHVMAGLWRDEATTRQVIRDQWLHTGDLAHVDPQGFVTITGRKKELIVMAVGSKVVPTHVEQLLCRDPLIQQAMVVGDGRNCLAALIVPDRGRLLAEISGEHTPAADAPSGCHVVDLDSATVRQLYSQRITQQLSGVAHHQQVRHFRLLSRPFSAEHGELTPKMTLRRTVIEAKNARENEAR